MNKTPSIYAQALANAETSNLDRVRRAEHLVSLTEAQYGRGSTNKNSPAYDPEAAFALYCRENPHLDI